MARTRPANRPPTVKPLMTWTRFHLPLEQEWPIWSANYKDIHIGPLADVPGVWGTKLGRMVENPQQAAFIIHVSQLIFTIRNHAEWKTLEELQDFVSSPACTEFLQNLPQNGDAQSPGDIASGSALRHLTLDDHLSSNTSPAAATRFQTFSPIWVGYTPALEGRVTFTSMVMPPHKVDSMRDLYKDTFSGFNHFTPSGGTPYGAMRAMKCNMFWILPEDQCVDEKVGKLDHTQGPIIFCHFFLWSPHHAFDSEEEQARCLEQEEASAVNPRARQSWNEAVSEVMPPVTAWEQQRWDIQDASQFWPELPEIEDSEDS